MVKKLWLLLSFLFICYTGFAQQGTWLWGTEGSIPSTYCTVEGLAMAIDNNSDVYLTGYFIDSLKVGGYLLKSNSLRFEGNGFIVKYDTSGNVLWATQSEGYPDLIASAGGGVNITTDNHNNVFITGYFEDTISFGSYTLTSPNRFPSVFLAKYNVNGNVQWATQSTCSNIGGIREAHGYGITADNSGNIYISGSTYDTISFGSQTLNSKGGNFFIAKYSTNGNLVWVTQPTRIYTSPGDFNGVSISADRYNNIYVTGSFLDTIVLGKDTLRAVGSGICPFVAKYDSNGNVIWAIQATNSSLSANCIKVGNDGGIYLTGVFDGNSGFGNINLSSGTSNEAVFLIKFDTAGNALWGKASGGSYYYGNSVVTDSLNHLYLVINGNDGGLPTFTYQNDTLTTVNNYYQYEGVTVLLKMDTSGNILCGSILGGGGDDVNSVAVNTSGKMVYVGGDLRAPVKIGPDSLTFQGNSSEVPFMSRWQPCNSCNIAITTSPNTTICSGQSVPLIAGGASDYTWSPALGLNTTSGNNVTATPLVTTTYHISASTGSCSAIDSVVINVNPTPNVNVSSPTVCSGNLATLLASGATSYKWQPATGLNTTTGDSVVANITVTTTYTVIGSSGNCFDTVTSLVTINPAPNKPTFTQHGDTLISSATNDNQWFYNGTILNNQTSQYLVIDTPGWYYVEVYNEANGCGTASDSVYVTPTGIRQLLVNNKQISVYPNPTSNQLIVESGEVINEITITNVLGQTVFMTAFPPSPFFDGEGPGVRLDVSNLPDGMYFITATTATGVVTSKFVVVR